MLDQKKLDSLLAGCRFWEKVQCFETVDSTNLIVKDWARQGAEEEGAQLRRHRRQDAAEGEEAGFPRPEKICISAFYCAHRWKRLVWR